MGTSTILCCNFTGVLGIKPCKGSHRSSSFDPLFQAGISKKKAGDKFGRSHGGLGCQRTSWTAAPSERRSKLDFAVYYNPQPESFLPFSPPSNSWISWLLGLVAVAPFVTQRLLTLTKEVDTTAETVEKIADAVEKVAEDVEKMADEIAEKLPEGGKLRNVATVVENLAKEAAKDAQLVEDFMDKVEEVDEEIEEVMNHDSKETVKVANDEK